MEELMNYVDEFERIIDDYCMFGKEAVKNGDLSTLDGTLKEINDFSKEYIDKLTRMFRIKCERAVMEKIKKNIMSEQ